MDQRPLLAITAGDPGGIGPEVVVKALAQPEVRACCRPVILATPRIVERALRECGLPHRVRVVGGPSEAPGRDEELDLWPSAEVADEAYPVGTVSVGGARAAHVFIERAVDACLGGLVEGLVTAPINKEGFRRAGLADLGHLEIFKRRCGRSRVYTMLVAGSLRCVHLTTHVPLRDVHRYVTLDGILTALRVAHADLAGWGMARPRFGVAALNPHGGDGGLIGREEIDEIEPAVAAARAEGLDVAGPVPADSIFNQALDGRFDVVLVMYHDQGHIPIKVHDFAHSLSVNLGLPFIRTSVDHGTAYDIAGRGVADASGMVEAIKLAASLCRGRWPR